MEYYNPHKGLFHPHQGEKSQVYVKGEDPSKIYTKFNYFKFMEQQFFKNATFGKSKVTLDKNFQPNCTMNIQCECNLEECQDLRSATSDEKIAKIFGEFIEHEFLKAIKAQSARVKKEWDKGEKITKMINGYEVTSLVNERPTEYTSIKGEFTMIE